MTISKQVNKLFAGAVGYRKHSLIVWSARYDDNIASNLKKMMWKTAIQMKDRTFNREERLPIIAFLQ